MRAELPRRDLSRSRAGGRARRPRAAGTLGRGGADAGKSARQLRTLDLRSRGRDLLLRLRRALGPRCGACGATRRARPDPRRRGGLVPKGGHMRLKWFLALLLVAVGAAVYGGTVL